MDSSNSGSGSRRGAPGPPVRGGRKRKRGSIGSVSVHSDRTNRQASRTSDDPSPNLSSMAPPASNTTPLLEPSTAIVPNDNDTVQSLRQQMQDLISERDTVLRNFNECKTKLSNITEECAHAKVNRDMLIAKVADLDSKLQSALQENRGIQKLNDELKIKFQAKLTSKTSFLARLMKSMDDKYITLAIAVDSKILKWAQAEIMEIQLSTSPVKIRNWNGRLRDVPELGLEKKSSTGSASFFIPLLVSENLTSNQSFYLQSYTSLEYVLETLVNEVLGEEEWIGFCGSAELKLSTVQEISTNTLMVGRVRQSLSDSVSNRKRLARDELLNILKYYSLKSSHDRRREIPIHSKEVEIEKARRNVLYTDSSQADCSSQCIDFSSWRTKPLNDLTSDGSSPEMFEGRDFQKDTRSRNQVLDDDCDPSYSTDSEEEKYGYTCLGIFRNDMAFHVWKVFLGYNPLEDGENKTEVSIFSIIRLDAWIATFISLLKVTEMRGGGRQRDYGKKFQDNLELATFQMITNMFNFVKYWCHVELHVPEEVPNDDYRSFVTNMQREATVILRCPESAKTFIAIRADWFSNFISPSCGTVHDCYIAYVTPDWKQIKMLTREVMFPSPNTTVSQPMVIEDPLNNAGLALDTVPPLVIPTSTSNPQLPGPSSNPSSQN